jgi:hypothetical protein
LAETTKAQTDPIIMFQKEDHETDYLEGDDVVIEIDDTFVQSGEELTVTCSGGCPEPGISYTHTFDDDEANPGPGQNTVVVFADSEDFPTAAQDGQPRWEGTWEVSIEEATRSFEVHVADVYRMPTENYQPTELATLQASGYPKLTLVNFTVYHAPPSGERTAVFAEELSTGSDHKAKVEWQIDPEVARYLDCSAPDPANCHDFEVEVSASKGNKGVETDPFQVDRATVLLNETSAQDNPVNRTEEANGLFVLHYDPSDDQEDVGTVHLASDILDGHGDTPEITVQLQRLTGSCGPGAEPENVTAVSANFTLSGYLSRFTPPRDFDLSTGGSDDQFRWKVLGQEDKYGNEIQAEALQCFDINPYQMTPDPVDIPDTMQRKRRETFVMNFSYANGATLDEGDNATEMRAVLYEPETDDPCRTSEADAENLNTIVSMTGDPLGDGLWQWSHKYPKAFPNLGQWIFKFCGAPVSEEDDQKLGAEDQWGNEINPNATEPFPLQVSSPHIEISTSVDGHSRNATRGFDRGDDVNLRVETTYPDGSSLNASDLNASYDGKLPVHVYRKDETGETTQITELELTEISPSEGTWRGSFEIPEVSAGAPLGTWDIEVRVKDDVPEPPNENVSRFPREVHPDTLHVATSQAPAREVLAGRSVDWAFVVRDGDGDRVTDERTGDAATGTITVDVRKWDNGKPGEFVATGLQPNYNPDLGAGAWVITWEPPRDLEPGKYVFGPNGTDIHGNVVADRARSRPFDVDIQHVTRDTIVAPPLSVERGGNVSVIFDGREGDTGRNGSVDPTIRLERRTDDGRWVIEEDDLYEHNRTTAGDHPASWRTRTSTPAGTYRFHLVGRAPDHSIIDAVSETFEVQPSSVTRPVFEPLVPFATKGTTVTAVVGHDSFDALTASDVRISGPQNITDAPGERGVDTTRSNWTVSWTIPVTVPKGEYVMHLEGEDRFGNNISVSLGPVTAGPVNLTVEPLRLPTPEVPRTSTAEYVFRVTYPDDSLMRKVHGTPEVVVYEEETPLEEANVTFDGVNWHATYTPPADAEITSYSFRVRGQDRATNTILPHESRSFRVATGTIERDIREGPGLSVRRLDTVTLQVEADADDRFVEFELAHYGPRNPDNVAGPEPPDPKFTGQLAHEWRPSLGVYEVQWQPPKDQTLGWYVIRMKGEDPQGNTLTAATEPFNLDTDRLEARWETRIESVTPGESQTYRVSIEYSNGEPMTDQEGTPDAFVRVNSRPVEPRPEVEYDSDGEVWKVTWDFPPDLPPGKYGLAVRGSDAFGNTIPAERASAYPYEPGTLSQLTGATVPGPGAAVAALAAAVTAAALGRVSSRR